MWILLKILKPKKCNIVDQQEIIAAIETSNTKTSTV